jgi:hypothetical protein
MRIIALDIDGDVKELSGDFVYCPVTDSRICFKDCAWFSISKGGFNSAKSFALCQERITIGEFVVEEDKNG